MPVLHRANLPNFIRLCVRKEDAGHVELVVRILSLPSKLFIVVTTANNFRCIEVKCDETKPTCKQCHRLFHHCDWEPRIAFKYETNKIVARTTGVSLDSCLVWNPSASITPPPSNRPKEHDTLPPYRELSTDEEREKKASYDRPGVYTLAVIPESFHGLPEYQTQSSRLTSFGTNRKPSAHRFQSTRPDVVILERFVGYPGSRGQSENPLSRKASLEKVLSPNEVPSRKASLEKVLPPGELPTTLEDKEADSYLLDHYRNVLANQICWLGEQAPGPDIFERYSADYSPVSKNKDIKSRHLLIEKLYLAILALSSLSLSQLNNSPFEDVLERYHMVITALGSSLKTTEDAHSDGALFTHYLLLLFEVAATGHREFNMWEQHSDRILCILQLRQKIYGKEPHGFIIVYTSYVDMYALLTTTGTGSFSKAIIEQNMLPPPEDALENRSLNMIFIPEALRQMPDLLKMNRELTLIALEMAQTGRKLKIEEKDLSKPRLEVNMNRCRSMQDLHVLLMKFHDTWSRFLERKTPEESWLHELAQLPSGPFTCRTHVQLFYRACKIYYHTSMYQGQSLVLAAEVGEQLSTCAREIILITEMMINLGCLEFRFIVFPIFMAGMASRVKEEKQSALEFLRRLEETSFGSNTNTTRKLLASIIEKQEEAIAQTGNHLCVSWIEELELSGLQLIMVGL
ncbi:uncharacterized protein Bfra_000179 [Botrytis fragariae]|uniref:Zn(2)-C6 fungal-type domain-containing protein n=1 Tax=Botrytis fragariae TaxID=1964551 RepID=A0A8H6EMT9_9HELO|nr:uncharacterized protein Bfra_000179 [Botrytis fragariae]KAF5878013.1 hypothetical protein Bfra_000179 [Botrytis fragariae]